MASNSNSCFILLAFFIAVSFSSMELSLAARNLLQTTTPAAPTLPNLPPFPTIPTQGNVPPLPTFPFPSSSLPQPSLPNLPTFPTLPGMTLPPLPAITSLPNFPFPTTIPFLTPPPSASASETSP